MKTSKMTTIYKPKLHTLIKNLPSATYHSTPNTFSSSQFKTLLQSEKLFIKKYIDKTEAREEKEAFDVGTYFHTAVLEPHKMKEECVVFPGKIRRGADWEKFKAKHKNKAIVTLAQKQEALGLVEAVRNSVCAQQFLVGTPEVSLFVELHILNGHIYAPHFKKMLTRDGWIDMPEKINLKGALIITVKVRADNLGINFISDLKSTHGDAEDEEAVHNTVKRWGYALSAALYLDMFSLVRPAVNEFWLIFASKEVFNSKSWLMEPMKIKIGRIQYMTAVLRLAEMTKMKFESIESTGRIKVMPDEWHWLQEKETDLL